MLPIGLSSCGKELNDETFAAYREAGITHMELALAPAEYPVLNYRAVREMADRHGVLLWSLHLPFNPFHVLDISRRELAENAVAYQSELIKRGAEIGIKTFVIHASGEPIAEEDRPERMKQARLSLCLLADVAKSCGGRIAVEDLPRTCLGRNSSDMLALIADHPDLRICFDTNHLLSEDPLAFIRAVGSKIVTTHVSDYDGLDEKHWLAGEGILPWHAMYGALIAEGYTGPWLYELGYAAPATRPRSRNLTPDDFVRNAQEIFAGKEITVIA
jgi:sugar phosphate isomerase/epimerase